MKSEIEETTLSKLTDAQVPGFEPEFDPDEADLAGAFHEDAISENEAKESVIEINSLMEEK